MEYVDCVIVGLIGAGFNSNLTGHSSVFLRLEGRVEGPTSRGTEQNSRVCGRMPIEIAISITR